MKFIRPNCEKCAHGEVCGKAVDVDILKTDMEQMKYFSNKEYLQKLSIFSVKIECRHYLDVTKVATALTSKEGVANV